jgi:antitoxin (DNA-binding transcriptional repressor) of toxin-antitoxin stability system
MTVVSVKDAKDRLDALLAASAKGEEVVIAREDGSISPPLTLTS